MVRLKDTERVLGRSSGPIPNSPCSHGPVPSETSGSEAKEWM